ncbi:MAG: Signal transduction histidine kinase [Verrucomicrobia bacterium]|jgi:signal transduction histidine kinase|nr:MAG: Signal transduction histidine kinase [Verrucomicrobiota bacterium]
MKLNLHLKFGIQEKAGLLVMAVAVFVAVGTALFLQQIAARTVENHELVDLSDESALRGWSIIDQSATLREEAGKLAADREIQQAVYGGELATIATRSAQTSPLWEEYLAVEILKPSGEPVGPAGFSRIRGLDNSEQIDLLRLADSETRNIPLISNLVRTQAEVREEAARDGDLTAPVWRTEWMTVFWVCVRVQPPPSWTREARYLTIAYRLEQFYSPRHLFFLVDIDAPGQPFLMHPDMAISRGFGRDELFERDLREEVEKLRKTSFMATEARMETLGLLEAEPLRKPFFFQEGRPSPELRSALLEKKQADPEGDSAYFKALSKRFRASNWQLSGPSSSVSDFRLLAPDKAAFEGSKPGHPSFIQTLEREILKYAGLPANHDAFEWKKLLRCKHCHISCIDLHLRTGQGQRRYLLMYAAFQEEFTGAIRYEIRSKLLSWVVLLGAAALLVAMAAAMSIVQPIRGMTATAHHILADEGGALHERLAELISTLPLHREDEIGDVGRASKRLFEEIISAQEQLEKRVEERTAELREANRQLEGLAKEKDAFLANVSHELRTPLTAVSGFLQLLQRKLQRDQLPTDKERDYVAKSLAAAGHLETLIDDILDFQKIIMGGITAEPEPFKVGEFLLDLRESLQFQARKNNNTLDFSWDHRLIDLHTDRQRLRQVLTNLISNACKFTKDGLVRLEAKRFKQDASDWVRFRVIDSGRGMTTEEQARLFTRFYTNKKMNQSGTGLGLVISEGLGRLLGGRVFLESSAPGKGSVFTLEIPLELKPASQPPPDPQPESAHAKDPHC